LPSLCHDGGGRQPRRYGKYEERGNEPNCWVVHGEIMTSGRR
jgi:hypothetical protein